MTLLYSRGGFSRGEFYSRVGAVREVDSLVELAYRLLNEKDYAESDQGAAVRDRWHVSFHGSQFPGDNQYACGRAALYNMLDVPRKDVFNRRSRQLMDSGKDMEVRLVWAWYYAGMLVSNPPDAYQTVFEDPDHWLTSTVDSILVKPRSLVPFVGEVKQVGAEVLAELKALIREPHPEYVRQVKCQIGMAHEYGELVVKRCHNTGAVAIAEHTLCPVHGHGKCLEAVTLKPVNRGYLYYVSRDNPLDTFEFMYEYDEEFMRTGRRRLAQWREAFIEEQLPQTNFDNKRYSHPFGWRWTLDEYPCKWCPYGDICRDDHDVAKERGGPITLRESAAIEVAQKWREGWDYDHAREAVYKRWGLAQAPSEAAVAA